MTLARSLTIALMIGLASAAVTAGPARAGVLSPVCKILKPVTLVNPCSEAKRGLTAGRKLLTGNVGGAVGGVVGGVAGDVASLGLGAIATWAANGAKFALRETAALIDTTSAPRLQAPWFQRVYWRLAGISVLLTLPCLFAAAIQALIRSDLPLLARAAFAYLPGAMLAVGICAQLTSLLLSAVDELCSLVSGAAGQAATAFLTRAGSAIVALSAARSPFLGFVIAVFTVAGAIVLWLELMMRAAAVYVVVALLPLAFAAFVWPARRIWALRAVELLTALILAKLAMVTVLTLGGAALMSAPSVAGFLAGLVLLILGILAPWAMLRMVPMAELASGAAGRLRAEMGIPSVPELLPAAAQGGAKTLGAAAAARFIHGPTAARAAAESVLAQMRSNNREPAEGPDSTPADGVEPEPPVSPSANLSPQGTQAAPRPASRFTAPNGSWDVLDLSGEARWRDRPIWHGDEHPGSAAAVPESAPGQPPPVAPPDASRDAPFPPDATDLGPDDT